MGDILWRRDGSRDAGWGGDGEEGRKALAQPPVSVVLGGLPAHSVAALVFFLRRSRHSRLRPLIDARVREHLPNEHSPVRFGPAHYGARAPFSFKFIFSLLFSVFTTF